KTAADPLHEVSAALYRGLSTWSQAYQSVAVLRQELLGGSLSDLTKQFRDGLSNLSRSGDERDLGDAVTLLRAKARYKTASFDPQVSEQAAAIDRILEGAWPGTLTLAFYANENPAQIGRIVSQQKLAAHRGAIEALVADARTRNGSLGWVGPIPIKAERYLDL